MSGEYNAINRWSNNLSLKAERELKRAYKTALKEIKEKLSGFYEKYSVNGSLSYAQAQKYNRLNVLSKEIKDRLLRLHSKQKSLTQKTLFDIIDGQYGRIGWLTEKQLGLSLRWAGLSDDAIKAAITNPLSGLTLPERLLKNSQQALWQIRQEITQGLIRGDGYFSVAKRLQRAMEIDYNKAVRVVWTESHRCKEQASQMAYDKLTDKGIKAQKMWVATLDEHTRLSHQQLDGVKVDLDGFFEIGGARAQYPGGFGIAEEDINCRCTTVIVYDDNQVKTRMEQGKGVSQYQTYEEWAKKKR